MSIKSEYKQGNKSVRHPSGKLNGLEMEMICVGKITDFPPKQDDCIELTVDNEKTILNQINPTREMKLLCDSTYTVPDSTFFFGDFSKFEGVRPD